GPGVPLSLVRQAQRIEQQCDSQSESLEAFLQDLQDLTVKTGQLTAQMQEVAQKVLMIGNGREEVPVEKLEELEEMSRRASTMLPDQNNKRRPRASTVLAVPSPEDPAAQLAEMRHRASTVLADPSKAMKLHESTPRALGNSVIALHQFQE
ncbi:unnamed protein product, partial [Chrysoparadoxa australica]